MSHWADLYLPISKVKKTDYIINLKIGSAITYFAFILKLVNLGLDKGGGRGG